MLLKAAKGNSPGVRKNTSAGSSQFYQVMGKRYTRVKEMSGSIRVKLCKLCSQPAPTLYRVKYKEEGEWVFVCPQCWPTISADNPFYVYGGTWKAKKVRK